jgi:hypothetical protein
VVPGMLIAAVLGLEMLGGAVLREIDLDRR